MPPPNTPDEGVPSPSFRPATRVRLDREAMERPDDEPPRSGDGPIAAMGDEDGDQPMADKPITPAPEPRLDWQALEYVGAVDQTLFCPICQTPLVVPVTTRCGHVFCAGCFDEMLQHNKCCPLDRKSFARELEKGRYPAKAAPRIYQNQLDELEVRCPNRHCPCVKPRSSIRRHYEEECGHTMVPCPGALCARPIARMDLGGAAADECRHVVTSCPDCGNLIDASNVDDHYEHHCTQAPGTCEQCGLTVLKHRYAAHQLHECPEAVRPCQYQAEGCSHTARRVDLAEHERACAFGAVSRMKQFFEAKLSQQDASIRQLTETVQQQEKAMRELRSAAGGGIIRPSSSGLQSPNTLLATPPALQEGSSLRRTHSEMVDSRGEASSEHPTPGSQLWQIPSQTIRPLEIRAPAADGEGSITEGPEAGPFVPQGPSPVLDGSQQQQPRGGHDDDAQAFLLAGLNSCEERVSVLQRRLAEQDARHSMMVVNEVLPLQEQLTEIRSAFTGLAMDLRYVIARQKSMMSIGGAGNALAAGAASGSGLSAAAGPSGQRNGQGRERDAAPLREQTAITPPRL